MTADPCDPVPLVIGWGADALADMRWNGIVATGGHFVNNGRVSALGMETDCDLDLSDVADINSFYSSTGSGRPMRCLIPRTVGLPSGGGAIASACRCSGGFGHGQLGCRPNGVCAEYGQQCAGDVFRLDCGMMDIALLAADRSDVNLTDKVIGVWDMSFTGDFETAALTIHYDPNQAAELGFSESGLNVYQQQLDGTWDDVTASVNTTTRLITTVSLAELGRFIVAPDPVVCGDPGQ